MSLIFVCDYLGNAASCNRASVWQSCEKATMIVAGGKHEHQTNMVVCLKHPLPPVPHCLFIPVQCRDWLTKPEDATRLQARFEANPVLQKRMLERMRAAQRAAEPFVPPTLESYAEPASKSRCVLRCPSHCVFVERCIFLALRFVDKPHPCCQVAPKMPPKTWQVQVSSNDERNTV